MLVFHLARELVNRSISIILFHIDVNGMLSRLCDCLFLSVFMYDVLAQRILRKRYENICHNCFISNQNGLSSQQTVDVYSLLLFVLHTHSANKICENCFIFDQRALSLQIFDLSCFPSFLYAEGVTMVHISQRNGLEGMLFRLVTHTHTKKT